MTMTCNWKGKSNTTYEYQIHELPVSFKDDQPGNYIYSKLNDKHLWVPIYIGEGDLGDRIGDDHHQSACIARKGATHVHVHLNDPQSVRQKEEADLLGRYTNAYKPSGCNVKKGG